MKRKKITYLLSTLALVVALSLSGLPQPVQALSNPAKVKQKIVNDTQNIGSSAKPPRTGGGQKDGNAVLADVKTVTLCGVTIKKNSGIVRNLQTDKYGKISIKLKSSKLNDLKGIFGEKNGQVVYNALESGTYYKSGYVTSYPSVCGQKIEVVSYDTKKETLKKVEAKIEVLDLYNKDPFSKKTNSVGKDYQNAVCSTNASGESNKPLGQQKNGQNKYASSNNKSSKIFGDGTTHVYTTTDKTYRKPYTFGCAGKYKATFTEYYSDGTTEVKTEIITVGLDVFIKETDNETQSNLVINE